MAFFSVGYPLFFFFPPRPCRSAFVLARVSRALLLQIFLPAGNGFSPYSVFLGRERGASSYCSSLVRGCMSIRIVLPCFLERHGPMLSPETEPFRSDSPIIQRSFSDLAKRPKRAGTPSPGEILFRRCSPFLSLPVLHSIP